MGDTFILVTVFILAMNSPTLITAWMTWSYFQYTKTILNIQLSESGHTRDFGSRRWTKYEIHAQARPSRMQVQFIFESRVEMDGRVMFSGEGPRLATADHDVNLGCWFKGMPLPSSITNNQ
jgi:hypothetical protein